MINIAGTLKVSINITRDFCLPLHDFRRPKCVVNEKLIHWKECKKYNQHGNIHAILLTFSMHFEHVKLSTWHLDGMRGISMFVQ